MKIANMHSHSEFSHDSKAKIYDHALKAIECGIDIFAVTDHADIQFYKERSILENVLESNKEAERVNNLFDKVKVLKGVELGDALFAPHYAEELLKKGDFDVIILSVHDVRNEKIDIPFSEVDFSEFTPIELEDFINKYFNDLLLSLETFPCDIAAHLTLPFRYINGKHKLNVDSRKFEDKITAILEYLIKNGIALEINAAGYNGSFIPERWVVEKYKAMGGYLITIGSDAHESRFLDDGLINILNTLKEIGFKKYYYFEKREAKEIEFE